VKEKPSGQFITFVYLN